MEIEKVNIGGHWLIEGANIDYLLDEDPSRSILVLDDIYSNLYSDYLFLGYNYYPLSMRSEATEVVTLYDALSILHHHKTITVCGDDPRPCIALFALFKVSKENLSFEETLRAVEREVVSKLYPTISKVDMRVPIVMGARALVTLVKELGNTNLGILLNVARNYDFGKGERVFNDRVAWTNALELPSKLLYAQLMRFLVEGHGTPKELFELRLDALGGEGEVKAVIGDEAFEVIKELAYGIENEDARTLKFIDSLNPGSSNIYYIYREDNKVLVECKVKCNLNLDEVNKYLPIRGYGIEMLELVTS